MTFYAFMIPHKKWSFSLTISSKYKVKQQLGGVPRKSVLLKFQNIKWDAHYIDDDKNILKLWLLGFLLFHMQGQILVKGLFV